MLIYAGDGVEPEAELSLIDSHFENLNNVQILAMQAKVVISGSYFDDIDINAAAFITLYGNTLPGAMDLIVTNITVVYFILSDFIKV